MNIRSRSAEILASFISPKEAAARMPLERNERRARLREYSEKYGHSYDPIVDDMLAELEASERDREALDAMSSDLLTEIDKFDLAMHFGRELAERLKRVEWMYD